MAQVLALGLQRRAADPDRPALIDVDDPSRTLSHHQLAGRVAEVAAALPDVSTGRRLVHVPLTAEMDPVIAYLAVRVAGHVTLVTDGHADAVAAHYRPDLVLGPRGQFLPASASAGPQHVLHPDLAVLVSTSGSTGSPKLVRLSHDNVLSNAAAIVSALGITPDDRAITLLPLHYCFGLSVLHSQLHAGGSVVLSTRSAADPDLGDLLARHRVSILPATPHVVDLLDVQGVLERDLPDLRLVTQAGGALAPDRVAAVAAQGRARGWSLVVMYGQTEATARMAVLPPELVSQHSGAVGWPIASSSFRLDTGVPEATTGVDPVGELVFSGPGVMLGYAEHPDDLALGRMVDELRTGDLARIGDDGLVRIVGRRADSVKIMGLRIDLGRVERQLAAAGVRACVTAADDSLQVTAETDGGRGGPDVRGLAAGPRPAPCCSRAWPGSAPAWSRSGPSTCCPGWATARSTGSRAPTCTATPPRRPADAGSLPIWRPSAPSSLRSPVTPPSTPTGRSWSWAGTRSPTSRRRCAWVGCWGSCRSTGTTVRCGSCRTWLSAPPPVLAVSWSRPACSSGQLR